MDSFERRYGQFREYGLNDPDCDNGSYYRARRLDRRNEVQAKKTWVFPAVSKIEVKCLEEEGGIVIKVVDAKPQTDH